MTTPRPSLSGNALSLDEANELKTSVKTDIIVVAGDVDAGKTTLISSMYEQFMEGPIGDLQFAGSLTLKGFEELVYMAKTTSDQPEPVVDHTEVGSTQIFLHLKLTDRTPNGSITNLLMVDWSGEIFRRVATSVEFARTLEVVRNSARFALLIDGRRIANLDERQHERTFASLVLRSCLDATILGSESNCDVVFTKWDLIRSGPRGTINFTNQIKSDITKDFAGRLGTLSFHETAARVITPIAAEPSSDTVMDGYGLSELLRRWFGDSPTQS